MKVLGVIPARYQSARLEGKPLADIGGKTMIQRVYEQAAECRLLSSLTVATDDDRIAAAVSAFGGGVTMTSPDCASGTDRVAEVAQAIEADIVVNIQGDEPFLAPEALDQLVEPFRSDPGLEMATLARWIEDPEALADTNVVKVTVDRNGFALYFSRSLIPHPRRPERHRALEHIGLYAFRRTFLLEYAAMPPTELERTEALEQLRALENGRRIRVILTAHHEGLSVDTAEDLEKARRFAAEREGLR